jgi:hypothetical protein|uniref:Uncharacterized protein n=1 Tax=Podoviridae sp. ctnuR9 TaxID=2825276 RepID=A0A8S5UFU5_9CAUD|nr:MAG TPA: hypothetical protein [Podoviridae sp. ctnuR9]
MALKELTAPSFHELIRCCLSESQQGEAVTVSVTNGSTGKIISSKRFEDHNDAMNYYSGQFSDLKSAEEYETMKVAFKMLGLM